MKNAYSSSKNEVFSHECKKKEKQITSEIITLPTKHTLAKEQIKKSVPNATKEKMVKCLRKVNVSFPGVRFSSFKSENKSKTIEREREKEQREEKQREEGILFSTFW